MRPWALVHGILATSKRGLAIRLGIELRTASQRPHVPGNGYHILGTAVHELLVSPGLLRGRSCTPLCVVGEIGHRLARFHIALTAT